MISNIIIKLKDDRYGRRWKVREAVNLHRAVRVIQHAMVTGSIGDTMTLTDLDGSVTVLADVIEVNSDNTERKPYTMRY